jgi:hypothetical protein
LLANLRQPKDGFNVPDNYFERFEQNLFARIKAEEEVESWEAASSANPIVEKTTLTQRLKNWLVRPQTAIAFSLTLVAILAVGILFQTEEASNTELAISEEEAFEYIENKIDQFSETIILESLGEQIAELEISTDINVNEEELNQYLEENIDDIDEILIDEIL